VGEPHEYTVSRTLTGLSFDLIGTAWASYMLAHTTGHGIDDMALTFSTGMDTAMIMDAQLFHPDSVMRGERLLFSGRLTGLRNYVPHKIDVHTGTVPFLETVSLRLRMVSGDQGAMEDCLVTLRLSKRLDQ